MIITREFEGIEAFEAWSGAVSTKETIISAGKAKEFDTLLDELFPNGCTEGELNDFLWFEDDYIYSLLGIDDGEDDD